MSAPEVSQADIDCAEAVQGCLSAIFAGGIVARHRHQSSAPLIEALEAIAKMYPDWPSERMALVRSRARAALASIAAATRPARFETKGMM